MGANNVMDRLINRISILNILAKKSLLTQFSLVMERDGGEVGMMKRRRGGRNLCTIEGRCNKKDLRASERKKETNRDTETETAIHTILSDDRWRARSLQQIIGKYSSV